MPDELPPQVAAHLDLIREMWAAAERHREDVHQAECRLGEEKRAIAEQQHRAGAVASSAFAEAERTINRSLSAEKTRLDSQIEQLSSGTEHFLQNISKAREKVWSHLGDTAIPLPNTPVPHIASPRALAAIESDLRKVMAEFDELAREASELVAKRRDRRAAALLGLLPLISILLFASGPTVRSHIGLGSGPPPTATPSLPRYTRPNPEALARALERCQSRVECMEQSGYKWFRTDWMVVSDDSIGERATRLQTAAATPTARSKKEAAMRTPTKAVAEQRRATAFKVTINSEPEGADVVINRGASRGRTPLTLELAEGVYGLRLNKEGYETKVDMLRVTRSGEQFRFRLDRNQVR